MYLKDYFMIALTVIFILTCGLMIKTWGTTEFYLWGIFMFFTGATLCIVADRS